MPPLLSSFDECEFAVQASLPSNCMSTLSLLKTLNFALTSSEASATSVAANPSEGICEVEDQCIPMAFLGTSLIG